MSHIAAVQAERSAGGRAEPARGQPFAVASVESCGAAAPPKPLLGVQASLRAQHFPQSDQLGREKDLYRVFFHLWSDTAALLHGLAVLKAIRTQKLLVGVVIMLGTVCRLRALGKAVQLFDFAGWAALVVLAGAAALVSLRIVNSRESRGIAAEIDPGSPPAFQEPKGRTNGIEN